MREMCRNFACKQHRDRFRHADTGYHDRKLQRLRAGANWAGAGYGALPAL